MCGIFCLLNSSSQPSHSKFGKNNVLKAFMEGQPRGPENSVLKNIDDIVFGFHRLAINGYGNALSEQPIIKNDCVLICNGEIYNWKYLQSITESKCDTGSDCEIIINLYIKYGINQTLQILDGVFAFVLLDRAKGLMYIARDAFGIRPLFMWCNNVYLDNILFASEMKMGKDLLYPRMSPVPFPPGNYMSIDLKNNQLHRTVPFYNNESFTNNSIKSIRCTDSLIHDSLVAAVKKRVDNTDREIACLLSGGLDSSLICAIVAKIYKELRGQNAIKKLHTWSIGMEGSEDLKYARKVADFLGTTHHEIICTEQEFLEAIPEVIYAIESRDTTTVRASVGNYLICKYIRANSSAKVIFNGDGSDELTGGYLYMHYAPDSIAFDQECRRLLKDIHLFDVLRSDRSISSHGLEARTPFLDRGFVQAYLSIPIHLRNHTGTKDMEKFLLRHAFDKLDPYLPKEVLYRRKEAFSDGVSKATKSWFEVIQDNTHKLYPDSSPKESEQLYYDEIFEKHFGDKNYTRHVMPYRWMPKFIEATDASARTLPIYNSSNMKCSNQNNL